MSERLTDADLAAMRARCEAATEGPWAVSWDGDDDPHGRAVDWPWRIVGVCNFVEEEGSEADAAFIAAARTDLPAALDEIDTLRAELADLRDENKAEVQRGDAWRADAKRIAAERDAAVAREGALSEALRRAARAMAAEADSDEACDMPMQARQWRDEVAAVESALADPSPATMRHMERMAALERFAATYRRQAELAGAAIDPRLRRVWSTAWHEFCEAEDALRAMDEARR